MKLKKCISYPKERKENFLSLYISFFERNMHNIENVMLYIEHIFDMFLQRRQSLLCIRISFAYSYAHNQRLCAYKDKDLRSLSSK